MIEGIELLNKPIEIETEIEQVYLLYCILHLFDLSIICLCLCVETAN